MLVGKRSEKVIERGHDQVSTFGIGADRDETQWRAVLRQLITLRLVHVDHEHWNVLRLAAASRDVLNGTRRLTLRVEAARPAGERRRRKKSGAAAGARAGADAALSPRAETLFHALREWRRGVAKEHAVPAYTVMHDATLRAIAEREPRSSAALGGISGIGATKLERYGDVILTLVRDS